MSVMIAIKPVRGIRLRFAPGGTFQHPAGAKRKQPGPKRKPRKRNRRIVLAAMLLLTSYWLWCHGCHGDEDNELFSRAAGYRDGRMETCRQLTTHQAPPTVNEVVIANILR
jgi:hypothetical protein